MVCLLILLLLVRASDQNIIDRQGILTQILLVAGSKIVLLKSKHTVTNIMNVHRFSGDERPLPKNRLVRIELWLSSKRGQGIHDKRFWEP